MHNRFFITGLLFLVSLFVLKAHLEKHSPNFSFKKKTLKVDQVVAQTEALYQFSLGFNSFLASLIWVELLQSADHTPLKENELSQEFSKVLAITRLDRRFEPSYSFGNSFLSILRGDRLGAYFILKQWKDNEPLYWRAHFYYGFHCYHEMNRLEEGAQGILKAASLPKAPPWLNTLGVGLLNENGQWDIALFKSIELFPLVKDPTVKQKLILRILAIRQKIQWEKLKKAIDLFHNEKGYWPETLPATERTLSSLPDLEISEELLPALQEKMEFSYDKITHELKPKKDFQEFLGIAKS